MWNVKDNARVMFVWDFTGLITADMIAVVGFSGIEQILVVVQNNAATAKQSAAAGKKLTELALTLDEMMSFLSQGTKE